MGGFALEEQNLGWTGNLAGRQSLANRHMDSPEAESYPVQPLLPMNPIAVIPKSTTHMLWRAVEAGAREGAKEAGVEMIWKGSLKEDDPAQQIQIVQQFVSEGVGGIVLAPIDETALR